VLEDVVGSRNAFFGHQRRVRGNAIKDSHVVGFFDFGQVCGVDEKFHGNNSG